MIVVHEPQSTNDLAIVRLCIITYSTQISTFQTFWSFEPDKYIYIYLLNTKIMRLSHVEARIEQQLELMNIISTAYVNLLRVDSPALTSHGITATLNVLKEEWQKFSIVHEALGIAIRELTTEDRLKITSHPYFRDNLYTVTHENYLSAVVKMTSLLDNDHGNFNEVISVQSTHSTPAVIPSCSHQARLPRINLPKFTGNSSDWLSFKDLFQSGYYKSITFRSREAAIFEDKHSGLRRDFTKKYFSHCC